MSKGLKIAVFGGTGQTGTEVIKQALERGHEVLALLRTPTKLALAHENLKIAKTNIFQEDVLTEQLVGCDVVISCLGYRGNMFAQVTIYSQSIPIITRAMRNCKVPRLIVITSWCTVKEPRNPKFVEWFVKPMFIGRCLSDMATMEQYIKESCQDLNYTIVRPPGLTPKPMTERPIGAVEGQFLPGSKYQMCRADVAKFMLDCLYKNTWDKKAVAIGY